MNEKERIIQLVSDSTGLLPSVVRVCLEAAAPHMLADAWEEGKNVRRCDGVPPNPYRPGP